MAHYESEFGLDYPLPKLDLIAIPDFVTGAMEQWGLITYRETSLLFDPNEGSTSSKELVLEIFGTKFLELFILKFFI